MTWTTTCRSEADPGIAALEGVFKQALQQCTQGKGEERHGRGAPLMQQPWVAIANTAGVGFLTGQSIKKLMEASQLYAQDPSLYPAYEREVLGAMVYAAMSILHVKAKATDAD